MTCSIGWFPGEQVHAVCILEFGLYSMCSHFAGSLSTSCCLSDFLASKSPLSIGTSQGSVLDSLFFSFVLPFLPRQTYPCLCVCLLLKSSMVLNSILNLGPCIPITTLLPTTSVSLGPGSLFAAPAIPDSSQSSELAKFLLTRGLLFPQLKCSHLLFAQLLPTVTSSLGLNITFSQIPSRSLLTPILQ